MEAYKMQQKKFKFQIIIQTQMQKKAMGFLVKNKENGDLNQYWYSQKTILFLANQAIKSQTGCFMSTPSIFYAIQNPKGFYVFDLDEKFSKNNQNYFKYDFNKPQEIPEQYHNSFDFVLADPPFIVQEVWEKYALAIKKIIKKNEQGEIVGKILLSTIDENQKMLIQILGVKRKTFRPSIPNLVYQYSLYANYDDIDLDQVNPEIGF